MDLYHSWIYVHVLNTTPFLWTVVISVFAFNFLGPILVWFVMNSKSIPILNKLTKKKEDKKAAEGQ
jgi:hypothetical protein